MTLENEISSARTWVWKVWEKTGDRLGGGKGRTRAVCFEID